MLNMNEQIQDIEDHQDHLRIIRQNERRQLRLGKKLAYILRYGAEKESLKVDEGWIQLKELMTVPLLGQYSETEVLGEIQTSQSYRKTARYQWEVRPDGVYVRAAYGRRFERNPYHENTHVNRLVDLTMTYICDNIESYDFEGFPDEFLINEIIHRIKRKGKLNNRIFRSILSETMEHLDLDGIYLTESTIRTVYTKCPNLRVLSLRNCGYMINDHFCEQLIRKCQLLESIDLSQCQHLTDRTIACIIKNLGNSIIHLILSGNQNYSADKIIQLVSECQNLRRLDIWDNTNCTNDVLNVLIALSKSRPDDRSIKIAHKNLLHPDVAPANPWDIVNSKKR